MRLLAAFWHILECMHAATHCTVLAQDLFTALGRPSFRVGQHSVSLRLLCVRMDDCILLEPVHSEHEVSLVAPLSPTSSLHSDHVSGDEIQVIHM